jgi:1-acyl-sn-glycerol-3-phosphate acyltransferase
VARPDGVQLGFWYHAVVGLLRPPLMGVTRRDWRGTEHLPRRGGFVAATNHVSMVDPITFAHYLWDNGRAPRYLAKDGVFRVPVIGRIIAACGQIPVYRETTNAIDAFSAAVAAVEAGECVAVYPEGTITRDPDLWPMLGKTGAARIALATGCPVIPVAQWGPQQLLAPYGKVPKVVPRPVMRVTAGPPVQLDDLRSGPASAEVLRTATDRIMAEITALLEGIRGERAPARRYDPRAGRVAGTDGLREQAGGA